MFRNVSKAALCLFLVLQIQGSMSAAAISAKRSLSEECEGVVNPLCVKLNLLSLVEKMSGPNQFNLYSGVTLVSEGVKDSDEVKIQREARSLDDDTEKEVETQLVQKVNSVLESYTFNVKLMDEETARSFQDEYEVVEDEGRRMRRKKKRHLTYLLLGAAIVKSKYLLNYIYASYILNILIPIYFDLQNSSQVSF